MGMPRLSAWIMALQKDLRSGSEVRSAIARIESTRPTPSCISWSRRENSWLRGPSPFFATRLTAASKPNPASSTGGSVESSTIGKVEAVAKRPATSRMSAAPSRPT